MDVLVGRQTRSHRDLDLAIDASDEATAIKVLGARGYRVGTDWRPVRVELARPDFGSVDLHPVTFGPNGDGRQAGPNGGWFDYPAATAFNSASFDGIEVACLSVAQQVNFRRGYPLRSNDIHDLQALEVICSSSSYPLATADKVPVDETRLTTGLPRLLKHAWATVPLVLHPSSGPVGMGSVTTGVEVDGLPPLVTKWVPDVDADALDVPGQDVGDIRRGWLT